MFDQTIPNILAVIPARYASSRFPGKPLVDIQGKPMIQHVWERVSDLYGHWIQRIIVATDDERIQQICESFGAEVWLTASHHASGTDRVWEVANVLPEFDWILNVQGDEPFIREADLKALIQGIASFPTADILTLVTPFQDIASWQDPNCVKAVLTAKNRALYFSRSPIPFDRDMQKQNEGSVNIECFPPTHAYHHLGLYLYRRKALAELTSLPPSPLECLEKLEQLRALEAGFMIDAIVVDEPSIGVDTPADLIRIIDCFK